MIIVQKYKICLEGVRTTWKFIVSYSPWSGGIYEAVVKIVKKILAKTFNTRTMSLEDMETLIRNVEWIANSRPISYVSQNDCELALTPNMHIFSRPILLENSLD